MTDPIKTQVLNALAARLAEVEGINSVQLETEFPFDLEEIPAADRPALFVWDDMDEPARANRLTRHALSLTLALFVPLGNGGFAAFSAAAEVLAARIHNKVAAMGTLRQAGVISLTLSRGRKAKAQENWGELVLSCNINYGHAAGDAFTTQV